jgi:glucose-6-phosphate 1-dehydrogenase
VPWYLRAGKCMATTATEVVVEFKPPAQRLFNDSARTARQANYLRLRLEPSPAIAFAARVKGGGEGLIGEQREFCLTDEQLNDEAPYIQLLGDAMRGDNTLFTGEAAVEAAWTAVDPVLKRHPSALTYKRGSWGPKAADLLVKPTGGWRSPG